MIIERTSLEGVLSITPPTIFRDGRGVYTELYSEMLYKNAGIADKFVQDDIITSQKNVLRGIHGSSDNTKLITCIHGQIFLVVVNNIPGSNQYGMHCSFRLSARLPRQILVPAGFGNGHVVLSKNAIFHYRQTVIYGTGQKQFTLLWNDPKLNINWPVRFPILSLRDQGIE